MKEPESARRARDWDAVLDSMMADLRKQSVRLDAYWAQQIAFGPVLVHALGLRLRRVRPDPIEVSDLRRVLRRALELLSALPEPISGDPAVLRILAVRQATALASGRRSQLARIAARLGIQAPPCNPMRLDLLKVYPLLGWRRRDHANDRDPGVDHDSDADPVRSESPRQPPGDRA